MKETGERKDKMKSACSHTTPPPPPPQANINTHAAHCTTTNTLHNPFRHSPHVPAPPPWPSLAIAAPVHLSMPQNKQENAQRQNYVHSTTQHSSPSRRTPAEREGKHRKRSRGRQVPGLTFSPSNNSNICPGCWMLCVYELFISLLTSCEAVKVKW